MPAEYTYDYAIIRVVPRVDRGEQINVGVIVSCADATTSTRASTSTSLCCWRSTRRGHRHVRANLAAIPRVCRGGAEGGPIGALEPRARFRWLVSPRSTMIQPSAVHTGRTHDPEAASSS